MAHEGHEGHGPGGWQGPGGPFGFGHGWGHRGWQGPRGPFGFGPGRFWGVHDELLDLRVEAAEVARLLMLASRRVSESKERLPQLRAYLDHVREELSDMIHAPAQTQATRE